MSAADPDARPMPNSYWVIPDSFAAGEYPGAKNPDETAAKLGALLEAGIDHFIDLTEAGERAYSGPLAAYSDILDEEARRRGLTIGWERHPIRDMDVPNSPESMIEILNAIDSALDDGRTVFVHCLGGVGRTGTVVGCWLARHGSVGDDSLERVNELFQGMEKSYRIRRSPETSRQQAYVRNWIEPPNWT